MNTHFERYSQHRSIAARIVRESSNLTAAMMAGVKLRLPPVEMEVVYEFYRELCKKPYSDLRPDDFQDLAEFVHSYKGLEEEFATTCHQVWAVNNHEAEGRQTYQVSPGLAQRLLLTELRGLRCGDLRLPYRALYIEIDPALGFEIPNRITGNHPVYGAYVVEDKNRWLFFAGMQTKTARTHSTTLSCIFGCT